MSHQGSDISTMSYYHNRGARTFPRQDFSLQHVSAIATIEGRKTLKETKLTFTWHLPNKVPTTKGHSFMLQMEYLLQNRWLQVSLRDFLLWKYIFNHAKTVVERELSNMSS